MWVCTAYDLRLVDQTAGGVKSTCEATLKKLEKFHQVPGTSAIALNQNNDKLLMIISSVFVFFSLYFIVKQVNLCVANLISFRDDEGNSKF